MKSKYSLFIVLLSVSLIFSQCKNVEFTFLGLFKAKIVNKTAISRSNAETEKNSLDLPESSVAISVSGIITDSLLKPLANVEIFLMKETTIEFHAVTDDGGNYAIENVNTGTYDIFLIAGGRNIRNKRINHITINKDNQPLNFSF